jgi:glucan-binding YG repeat protein
MTAAMALAMIPLPIFAHDTPVSAALPETNPKSTLNTPTQTAPAKGKLSLGAQPSLKASSTEGILENDTLSAIQSELNYALGEAESGDTITVTGTKADDEANRCTAMLTLNIPEGVTVLWKAKYYTNVNLQYQAAINVTGGGTLEVGDGGNIANFPVGDSDTYQDVEATDTIYVSAGSTLTVSSGGKVAIGNYNAYSCYAINSYGVVNVTGGTVVAYESADGCIRQVDGEVNVSSGTVITDGIDGMAAIRMGKGLLNVTGGVINAGEARGIETALYGSDISTVNITGGEISATSGSALYVDSYSSEASIDITVSGSGIVEATEQGGDAIFINEWARGDIDITVSGGGTVEATEQNGNAIFTENREGCDIDITVSGGTVQATGKYGSAISIGDDAECDVDITVNGTGTVSSTGQEADAIYDMARDATVTTTVDGDATVSASGQYGCAIDTYGTVNVPGGTVSVSGKADSSIIARGGEVNISGGTVSATGDAAFAVLSYGTVNVSAGAVSCASSKTYGAAIKIDDTYGDSQEPGRVNVTGGVVSAVGTAISQHEGANTTIIAVEGGTVSSESGSAISLEGEYEGNSTVTVSGGTVRAAEGVAIYTKDTDGVTVTVNGGCVFAYGTAILGIDDVINMESGSPAISSPGVVIAWNEGEGTTTYTAGTDDDITVLPESDATAVWDNDVSGQGGITYKNGANTGFISLDVTVDPVVTIGDATISGTVGTALTGSATITIAGDAVGDELVNENAAGWFASLPEGVTANAAAAEGSKTITLSFGGIPTVAGDAAFDSITIPAGILASGEERTAAANAEAKFAITPPPTPTYTLTVENGTDTTNGGPYTAGTTVNISANAPAAGKVFDAWESDNGGTFAAANSAATTFTMPASAVTVTATYKDDVKDTDGDGVPDYIEDKDGTDPSDPADFTDTDEDGVPDYVEEQDGTDPNDKDSFKDTDGDGVPDYVYEHTDNPPAASSGWVYENRAWYLFDADGHERTGWAYDNRTWYFLDTTDGHMKTGWIYDHNDKAWYYLAGNGAMKIGWVKDDGNWYYLSGNGAMAWGKWFKDTDGSWYYLSGNGKMLTGKQAIGGKVYSFKSNGVWVS